MASEKKILAILNPHSRGGDMGPHLDTIQTLLSNTDLHIVETNSPDEAIVEASKAEGFDLVMPLGGDGTAHSVVNGLMQIEKAKRPILALLPAGSGNDSCRMAEVPLTLSGAIDVALNGVAREFDLGRCNGRYFINSIGIGIDARIAAYAVELKANSNIRGLRLYTSSIFYNVFKDSSAKSMRVVIDGNEVVEQEFLLCAATNGKTYGSGIAISPEANPTDGKLNLVLVDAIGLGKILTLIPVLFAKRVHKVKNYHGYLVNSVQIETTDKSTATYQLDGEIYFDSRFDISILKNELSIMTPSDFVP